MRWGIATSLNHLGHGRVSLAFRDGPPRRVAIFRALQLGDLLCAVPALRAIRAALPESEIALIGLPWARSFVSRYAAYLDGFYEFPGWPGLPEQPPRCDHIPAFLAAMQAERFDLVMQLHGSGELTNPLAKLLGARKAAGFYTPGSYRPDPDLFLAYPNEGLEVRRLLKLVEFLGMPAQGECLEFPVYDSDRQALKAQAGISPGEARQCVCIHPGASVPERRWPADKFAVVARALAARGLRVVLTGTAPEAELTRQVARAAGVACLDLAGQTDLGVLAALLSEVRLLVCNDTGVSHLAAALSTPSVIVSTGDNPARWAPADGSRHRVLGGGNDVGPAEVVEQAEKLLSEYSAPLARFPDPQAADGLSPASDPNSGSKLGCCVGSTE
jgi:ADP-heptose:LPS heptosyltransferase